MNQVRRSKRQAGIDVSPVDALNLKKVRKHPREEKEGEQTSENCLDDGTEAEIQADAPNVDESIPPATNGVPSSSDVQTQESENKSNKKRGPTRMRNVAKHIEDKVEVEFNALGEHVGRGSVTLSSFLGPLVREHVSVLLDDWRHLDDQTKDTLWEEIQVIV